MTRDRKMEGRRRRREGRENYGKLYLLRYRCPVGI